MKKQHTRSNLVAAMMGCATLALAADAAAQGAEPVSAYPSRPVRLIVAQGTGS